MLYSLFNLILTIVFHFCREKLRLSWNKLPRVTEVRQWQSRDSKAICLLLSYLIYPSILGSLVWAPCLVPGMWRWKRLSFWYHGTQAGRRGSMPPLAWFTWQYQACQHVLVLSVSPGPHPQVSGDISFKPLFSQNLHKVSYLNSKVTIASCNSCCNITEFSGILCWEKIGKKCCMRIKQEYYLYALKVSVVYVRTDRHIEPWAEPVMRLPFFQHPVTCCLTGPLWQEQQQLCSARPTMTTFPVCAYHLLGH